jgi:AraC-like DNA-binding protein
VPYRELPAQGRPVAHVACLWLRDPEATRRVHRVVPDACVDVVWVQGAPVVVAGPATGPVLSDVPAGAAAMGVRFRVGAAGPALGWPAHELLDQTVPLELLWGAGAAERIAARAEAAAGPRGQLMALAAAVAEWLAPSDRLDPLVRAAARGIAQPGARVERLDRRVGLGERQLRRRFSDAVGYGPKTLQRVLRFQRFLALARDGAAPGERAELARIAIEAGYADQAHLTRECRRLAGLPPAALLAAGAVPAGETSDSFKTRACAPASMAA